MSDNEMIRRFFRREDDELTVHECRYTAHLKLVACHVLARVIADLSVEVSATTNFEENWAEKGPQSVLWESCQIGFEEHRQYITAGYVFAIHHGIGDLKFVAALVPDNGASILRFILRSEDIDRLPDLLRWIECLENDGHPLKGKLFSLTKTALQFLPSQSISRDDVVVPGSMLEEIERNFSFLDNPARYPAPLRHRAILLAGTPGVGKTMIAKWLSGRFTCTGLWCTPGAVWEVGPSAVFDLAIKLRPTLLILEDLDVAAGERKGPQPLGDLLGQMDGFVDLTDVAIIATTNCPEVLDHALDPEKRPGRFHRLFDVRPPGVEGRRRMLRLLLLRSEVVGNMPDAAFDRLIEASDKRTGAQLTEMVRDLESLMIWKKLDKDDENIISVVEEIVEERLQRGKGAFGFIVAESA